MSEEKEIKAAPEFSTELTEKEKLEIEREARAEVAKALKADARAAFKEEAKRRIQAEAMYSSGKDDSGDDVATIDLDLASYPKYIMLDGAVYHSGRKYTKRKAVIAVLQDQMDRGWRQEAARLGAQVENTQQTRKVLGRMGLRIN